METDGVSWDGGRRQPQSQTTTSGRPSRRLGEILVEHGTVTVLQLEHALEQQDRLKLPIGQSLVRLGYTNEEQVLRGLASQLGLPYVDLDQVPVDRRLRRLINRSYARRHAVLPIVRRERSLTVATKNPSARHVMDDLARMTGLTVNIVVAGSGAMERAFRRLYDEPPGPGNGGEPDPIGGDAAADEQGRLSAADELTDATSRRADELFWRVLRNALDVGCSDLHLEALPSGMHVRYRIDGVLRRPHLGALHGMLDAHTREVVSRIKVLARLDIAERRRPQDGSFRVTIDHDGSRRAIDLRVSAIPSHSGESVVIRILDRTRAPRSIVDLDLSPDTARGLEEALSRTTGIFLVTGPTGSGKSTTLYACLMKLHRPEIRILTAEDPVEYVFEELSQSQVNDEIGNTFAAYLRAFLRHDPEVIMIGEIRDEATAEMAFRAAQTGHLLLSTLHTNSAIAALPRLLDLGIEASLIGSSLIGVLSQRLARRTCRRCREAHEPDPAALAALLPHGPAPARLWRGAGCQGCAFTGYRGRLILADLWIPDDQDLALITRGAPYDEVRASATRTTSSMAADALERLRMGETTAEELLRVLPYSAIVECGGK
jgi:type IV pilus assembly protein PilB